MSNIQNKIDIESSSQGFYRNWTFLDFPCGLFSFNDSTNRENLSEKKSEVFRKLLKNESNGAVSKTVDLLWGSEGSNASPSALVITIPRSNKFKLNRI